MITLPRKKFNSGFGPIDLLRLELTSGDVVRAYDLRHLKEARWLRASSRNYCSFCLRFGENPHDVQNTIGWISTTNMVHIFRHKHGPENMIVFRDMIAGLYDPKAVSCFVLPKNIVMSWPVAVKINGKKIDDIISKTQQEVFVPIEYCC